MKEEAGLSLDYEVICLGHPFSLSGGSFRDPSFPHLPLWCSPFSGCVCDWALQGSELGALRVSFTPSFHTRGVCSRCRGGLQSGQLSSRVWSSRLWVSFLPRWVLGPHGLTRIRTQGRLESRSSHLSPRDAFGRVIQKGSAESTPSHLKDNIVFAGYSKFHRHTEKSEAATPLSPEITQPAAAGSEAPAQWVGRKTPKAGRATRIRPQVQLVRPQREHTEFCFHWLSFPPSACCLFSSAQLARQVTWGTGAQMVCKYRPAFKYHLCLKGPDRILFHKLVNSEFCPFKCQNVLNKKKITINVTKDLN